jgi:hypothetical protein
MPAPPALPTPTQFAQLCADVKLLRAAMTGQGKALAELASQVARLTRRQDDQDARHSEIEDRLAQELTRIATSTHVTSARLDTLAQKLDDIFLALTQALTQPH